MLVAELVTVKVPTAFNLPLNILLTTSEVSRCVENGVSALKFVVAISAYPFAACQYQYLALCPIRRLRLGEHDDKRLLI